VPGGRVGVLGAVRRGQRALEEGSRQGARVAQEVEVLGGRWEREVEEEAFHQHAALRAESDHGEDRRRRRGGGAGRTEAGEVSEGSRDQEAEVPELPRAQWWRDAGCQDGPHPRRRERSAVVRRHWDEARAPVPREVLLDPGL
ncbi:MAG: hypothetical protein ACK56I_15655, partial [bacterium]